MGKPGCSRNPNKRPKQSVKRSDLRGCREHFTAGHRSQWFRRFTKGREQNRVQEELREEDD